MTNNSEWFRRSRALSVPHDTVMVNNHFTFSSARRITVPDELFIYFNTDGATIGFNATLKLDASEHIRKCLLIALVRYEFVVKTCDQTCYFFPSEPIHETNPTKSTTTPSK